MNTNATGYGGNGQRAAFRALSLMGTAGACAPALLLAPAAHADAAADADAAASSGALDAVVVKGVRPLQSDKLGGDLHNVPQTVTVVSAQLMADQGVTRLEDALKNVPGITLNAGEGAARGDTVNLRGFSAFNDFFLDGIRDAAVYDRDSFNLESVEVVKGPSAILFGRGSTGGAINQVTKAPTLSGLDTLTAELGTNHEYRATTDIDVPLGAATAFRFNAMGESSEVADRDEVLNRRWGVAPSMAFGLGEADSAVVTYLHEQENNVPDAGIPFVDGRPAPVPRQNYYGLASDFATSEVDIGTLRYKHDFSSTLSIADTLRYAHYEFNYQDDMPNFGANPPTPGTPLSSILVGRDAPGSSGTQVNLTNQTDLNARFATGEVSHALFAGIELSRQSSDLARYSNPFNTDNDWIPETPLLDPDPFQLRPSPATITSQQNTVARSYAAYATDTLSFGPYVDVMAGLRFDRFQADYAQYTRSTGAELDLDHTDDVVSPRAAVIFKATPTQSYYVSYGTSFDPSAEALALTSKTANLGPVKAKSYEAGAKNSWLDGGLSTTAAVFRTEVDNAQTNDPENPTITVLNGDQRVTGLELSANGYVTEHLELVAGYTYLDGKTVSSGTAAYVGKQLPNVARNAVNLWTEYEFTDAFEVGLGGNWLDARYADSAQTARMPGYVVWNAMASYKLGKTWFVQLNVINLANKLFWQNAYYTSVSENHVIPGPGRTAKLTLRMSF
ncbi:MAG TPA: TonB-dependent siderophore receptor [Steroidobacteraceae bacterium]|jgi:catecholate siderophore receptor|nr:TonB-dependent siderophore receptor [Steroidobacteraceae bacterium]